MLYNMKVSQGSEISLGKHLRIYKQEAQCQALENESRFSFERNNNLSLTIYLSSTRLGHKQILHNRAVRYSSPLPEG